MYIVVSNKSHPLQKYIIVLPSIAIIVFSSSLPVLKKTVLLTIIATVKLEERIKTPAVSYVCHCHLHPAVVYRDRQSVFEVEGTPVVQ